MEKPKIYAILVSEMTNTVSVHFEGFSDYEDKDFSRYIGKELNIENLPFPKNDTIHYRGFILNVRNRNSIFTKKTSKIFTHTNS